MQSKQYGGPQEVRREAFDAQSPIRKPAGQVIRKEGGR